MHQLSILEVALHCQAACCLHCFALLTMRSLSHVYHTINSQTSIVFMGLLWQNQVVVHVSEMLIPLRLSECHFKPNCASSE